MDGYEQFQEATNTLKSEVKKQSKDYLKCSVVKWKETDYFTTSKKDIRKIKKISKLGSALRDSAGMVIGDVYDRGAKELGKHISRYIKESRTE